MAGAIAANASGQYLAALGDVLFEPARIFVIDVVELIGTKVAGFSSSRWAFSGSSHDFSPHSKIGVDGAKTGSGSQSSEG